MKTTLFNFQEKALQNLRIKLDDAINSYKRTHTPQVISFTAPTGAGKTIIIASLIESVFFGNDSFPEQQDAIFVWISDSPQLNEQSKQKIEFKTDKLVYGQCVTITEDSFDKEMLEDGHVYFLNTQKLGKSSNLVKHSDMAEFAVIGNFFFVVFEAPDFCDEDADQDTANGHQEIGGKHVKPVVKPVRGKSICVDPGEFQAA